MNEERDRMMDEARHQDTGRLALAIGVAAAGSAVCLATYFAVQGPFGTINDIGNAATGVLSAGLAWRLRRQLPDRLAILGVGAATVGAGLTVAGSALVISGTTGFFFAGLVSSVGFAGIGAWLVVLSRGDAMTAVVPPRLRWLGIAAGALMALGIAAAPGIALGLDDMATAPGWAWIGLVGWLGIFVVYPAWAIWLASVELRGDRRAIAVPRGTGAS
jgi:drug/metabolite transporter (DMT)-like permease